MIKIYQQNDLLIPVQIQDETGAPVNLSDADVRFVVSPRSNKNKHLIEKRVGEGIEIVDVSEGRIRIDIRAEDVRLPAGVCLYELLLVDALGHRYTAEQGYFVIGPSITKEVV